MIASSIKSRVLFVALTPLIVVAVFLAGFYIRNQINTLENSLHERGNSIARHLAPASEYGVFSGNTAILRGLANSVLNDTDVASVTILDAGGEILIQANRSFSLTQHESAFDSLFFQYPITSSSVAVDDFDFTQTPGAGSEGPLGWVVVELTKARTDTLKNESIVNTVLITLLVVLFSSFLALSISRNVTRPITRLTRVVSKIEDGDLDVNVGQSNIDDIRMLENGMHNMAQALRQHQNRLKEKIDEATADLQASLSLVEHQNVELEKARQEALDASKAKSEFLANISHEIRTPMNGILGFINQMKKTTLTSQQQSYTDVIERSANNLLNIIHDILDISKIEAGKVTLVNDEFSLRTSIDEVIHLLEPAVYKRHLDIVSLVAADVPDRLIGDQTRLRQVLTNLVDNAIKFTPYGEIVVRTSLLKQENDTAVIRISVADTGVGISEENQGKLFKSFTQVDTSPSRLHAGTGLGLAICSRLVDLMGGAIGVTSQRGAGSTFWFTFKAQVAHNQDMRFTHAAVPGNCRILLYDPNPLLREMLIAQITSLGQTAQEINQLRQIAQALEKAASSHAGLIIIGFNSKDIEDELYLNHLVRIRHLTDWPLLVLLNSTEQELQAHISDIGPSIKTLPRPPNLADLHKLLTEWFYVVDITPSSGREKS